MTYWLGIDTPEVSEQSEQEYGLSTSRKFGFPEGRRKSVEKIRKGDYILNYVTKRQRFFAVWEVTGEHIYDPNHEFAGRAFPNCVEVQAVARVDPEYGIENRGVSVRRSAIQLDDELGRIIYNEIRDLANANQLDLDFQEIHQNKIQTERIQLVAARLGQGKFHTKLLERWENKSAVTGNSVDDAIRASHAKPWKISNHQERLDPQNGLPLLATLDALFDAGLIAFDDFGGLMLSPSLRHERRRNWMNSG